MISSSLRLGLAWTLALLSLACASGSLIFAESAPDGRLPDGVRPLRYAIDLQIVPQHEHFSGSVEIELELTRRVRTIWMHGQALDVSHVEFESPEGVAIEARWEPAKPAGVAAVRLSESVGPGRATLRIGYQAAYDRHLRGLYRVDVDDDAYIFTQFQPLDARRAFPGFDEPAFKTPFDITLRVPEDAVAIASTPEIERTPDGDGRVRIRYATTPPLPTYLLAFAVGPFDVRTAPPIISAVVPGLEIPFRGVAVRGRGRELRYALAETPALLAALERYFASPYPYAKLDMIAVPDFPAGAMENVGAITFREPLLLLDAGKASERQRRDFTYVMAHELAHQWFGNLVTIPWWDDLWLNEAFATWLGYRVVQDTAPEQQAGLQMRKHAQHAMREDSRRSSRRIRQPIESAHDVANAFDSITYSKGGAVLGMFEHWLGEETFRRGIRSYVEAHREGNARSADLAAALSGAAGRDLGGPLDSFLSQPGVPLIETRMQCIGDRAELELRQSRYLPLGSQVDPDVDWQVPVCARYGVGDEIRESCELLETREGRLALDTDRCPDWVMPNADAAGYYRFSSPAADARRLLANGLPDLSPSERLALADSLEAEFRAGRADADETFTALASLAGDENRAVAVAPMALIELARKHLVDPRRTRGVEAFAARIYRPRFQELGWQPQPGDDGEDALLRRSIIAFLIETARDVEIRSEALQRGLRYARLAGSNPGTGFDPSAVEADLAATVLAVAVQDGGAEVFDALLEHLEASDDSLVRTRLLRALGATDDPELAERARELSLDPRLRVSEIATTLHAQIRRSETRASAWTWIEEHFEALVERMGETRAGWLPWLAGGFCDDERAAEVSRFLEPRVHRLEGGPRNLAGAVETIRLCAALVSHQEESAQAFFDAELSRDPGAAR